MIAVIVRQGDGALVAAAMVDNGRRYEAGILKVESAQRRGQERRASQFQKVAAG